MRKNKARGQNRAFRDAIVTLKNNIVLNALQPSEVREYFAAFLAFGNDEDFRYELPRLLEKKNLRDALYLYARDPGQINQGKILDATDFRLITLHKAVFSFEQETLRLFSSLAARFESEFLYGEFERALQTLDEVFELTGYSLWLMRNRILVLAKAARLEEMNQYCEECKSRSRDGFVTFLLSCFLFLATNPLLHSRRVILSTIDELAAAGLHDWSDLLVLMLAPAPVVRHAKKLSCMSLLQLFPLVDQWVLLRQVTAHNLAIDPDFEPPLRPASVLDYIERKMPPALSISAIATIARHYEQEEYNAVVDAIITPTSLLAQDAVDAANLVAKSMEIAGCGTASRGPKGPLKELVAALRGIYSMDSSPGRHVDALTTASLQMHHLSFGPSIQLLPYQAMPNQYAEQERIFAAKRAWLLHSQPSSWLTALAKVGDPVLLHKYEVDEAELPTHRRLKQSLRRVCLSDDPASVYARLDEYREIAPLKRDYYELASSTLGRLEDFGALIGVCATALADRQSSFSAFPMGRLVDHIEAQGRSEVDDLIVINAFVKNVSSEKDYLLNETFEELLHRNGVDRPSDVASTDEDSQKIDVLLRDISSVETLDFLSVFESSSDVRAERIKILDLLLEREAIGQDRHRAEVEEILLQALVDSAATEYSMHKIDINDQALRRRLSDDVKSMFTLYKSSSDSDAGDFIRLDVERETDTTAAALVGDKNTTLQKIYSAVRDAFLYDDKHGLDKNLSAEIRHGFFSNLMRSKPERQFLLTEKDEQGEYKKNEYWREVNVLLNDDALDEIDGHLAWFSAEFNALLSRAEEWMKVTTQPDSERAFSFPLLGETFLPMKVFADSASDSDQLLDYLLSSFWVQTESCLDSIRNKLDGQFRTEVDALFEELIQRMEEAKGDAVLSDLLSAIRTARNEVREDISTIKEWFRRGEALSGHARTLQELVAISIECYKRVRRIDVKPSFEADAGIIGIALKGRESKALVVALMNLYENCIRHSGFGTKTHVTLQGEAPTGGNWRLAVVNPVTEPVRQKLENGGLAAMQRRISDPAFAELVRTEGGSGLRKVMNQLSAVSDRCGLSIALEGCEFVAAIRYVS